MVQVHTTMAVLVQQHKALEVLVLATTLLVYVTLSNLTLA